MFKSFTPGILAVGLVAACAPVGPDYSKPETPLSGKYLSQGKKHHDVAVDEWWRRLNDKKLNELVARATTSNLDLATARSRVDAAEISLRQAGPVSHFFGSYDAQVQRTGGSGIAQATTDRQTFSGSYVLDMFGGARRGSERANANLQAARLDEGAARMALIAGVTSTYIDARYFQEALALTRQNIDSRRQTLKLIEGQREVGAVSELNVAQTKAQLDTAIASLPALEAAFEAQVFALATLLAEPSDPLMLMLQAGAPQPFPAVGHGKSVAADLLRSRPDVMAAERRYAAAVAGIGVAEAQLYPSLSLQGTVIEGATGSWSFGPSLSLPVLNQGALRAQRDGARIAAESAEIAWRKTVISAVEDVQTAQSAYDRKRREIDALRDVKASTDGVLDLSKSSFEFGDLSLLDLLEAERAADTSKMTLAAAVRDAAKSWSSLMVASGRGWQLDAE